MKMAIALILLTVGSVVFHIVSPWWSTPIASNWSYIDDTIDLTFWITGIAFIAVILFMAYCIIKFSHKEGRKADYEPENKKLEVWLTVITSIGVAGMLAPGLFVWNQYITVPKEATPIEVMAQQWQWGFRLPGEDGVLGTSHTRNINDENTFGLNVDDQNGMDDVLIEGDDLHIPLGKPVQVLLRSVDVLHNFYVPQFRAKMDMVPGTVTYYWFTPIRTGTFDILCAELCGTGHHVMRGTVVVDDEAAYAEWLAEQSTYKDLQEARNRRPDGTKLAASAEGTAPAQSNRAAQQN